MAHKDLIVVGLPEPFIPDEVTSLRKTGEITGQVGDIVLDPGANVTITRSGNTFTIGSTGGGGVPGGSCAGQLLAFDGLSNVWAKIVTDAGSAVVVDNGGDVVLGVTCP